MNYLNKKDNQILIIGISIFLFFLFLSGSQREKKPNVDCAITQDSIFFCELSQNIQGNINIMVEASRTLRGKSLPSDLAQDIVGYRALAMRNNAYPVLGTEYLKMGLNWNLNHESTHPPTAFLLVAPIAFLPWELSSAIWAWAMLILVLISLRFYGFTWKASIGLTPIIILWPPIAKSLEQLTVIWLFAAIASYQLEKKHQIWSGVLVGIATITKIFPALLILSFLAKRKWKALISFSLTASLFVGAVFVIHPEAFSQYLDVNTTNSIRMILRPDNAALLINSLRWGGWIGTTIVSTLFIAVIWRNKQSFYEPLLSLSSRFWTLLNYFSIALLPVLWTFSLAPLLPIIMDLILEKKFTVTLIAITSIIIPLLLPSYGTPLTAAMVVFLVGVGLLLSQPTKDFTIS